MAYTRLAMRQLGGFLRHCRPNREVMLRVVREGFSCSTEVAGHLVRNCGYGGRRAHRLCGTFVRMCRERGVKAAEASADILDEAARFLGEQPPQITTDELRRLLDPIEFINAHDNTGGTAPGEARRMLAERQKCVEQVRAAQADRRNRVQVGDALLKAEVDAILAG